LATIAIDSLDHALLILGAWSILDFLLNGTSEEALQVQEIKGIVNHSSGIEKKEL